MPLLAARHSESRGHAGLCIAATLHLVEIGTIVAGISLLIYYGSILRSILRGKCLAYCAQYAASSGLVAVGGYIF